MESKVKVTERRSWKSCELDCPWTAEWIWTKTNPSTYVLSCTISISQSIAQLFAVDRGVLPVADPRGEGKGRSPSRRPNAWMVFPLINVFWQDLNLRQTSQRKKKKKRYLTLGKHWNQISAGSPPRTPLGSSRRSSRQPSRLGSFTDDKMLWFSINKMSSGRMSMYDNFDKHLNETLRPRPHLGSFRHSPIPSS